MDNSPSRSPSPTTTMAAGANSRGNPFSIDYILSAKRPQPPNEPSVAAQFDQLNMMNQQRDQLVAVAAAAVAHQTNELGHNHQHYHLNQQQQQQTPSAQQIKFAQQQLQQQQQQAPHPNVLYFMACMLFQQQQQQQQQRQPQQQQQQSHHLRQQQVAQLQAAAAAAAGQQLANNRQPMDLARSPMDSLAIMARLMGANPATTTTQQNRPVESNGLVCKQHRRSLPINQTTIRHQPYPLPADRVGHSQPTAPLISLQHQHQHHQQTSTPTTITGGRAQNASAAALLSMPLDLLGHHQHRNAFAGTHKSPPTITGAKCGAGHNQSNNSTGSATHPQQHQHQHITATNTTTQSISNQHGDKLDNLKPAHNYIGIIAMCILSTPEKRMVLNDIYQFILDNYPYYRNRGSGWRNSVRHNLSLNECFQKSGRAANGKGHYWTIHPANMDDFMAGDFRRRRAQRKVRRWNNMDVPSDESEDESMEDATKPPLPEYFKRSLEMHRRLELGYHKSAEATTAFMAAAAAGQAAAAAAAAAVVAPQVAGPVVFREQELS